MIAGALAQRACWPWVPRGRLLRNGGPLSWLVMMVSSHGLLEPIARPCTATRSSVRPVSSSRTTDEDEESPECTYAIDEFREFSRVRLPLALTRRKLAREARSPVSARACNRE